MHRQSYGPSMANGRGQQGDLRQLPDGRWRARYRENGRNGRRPQATFATRDEGAKWLREGLGEGDEIAAGNQAVVVRRREAGRTLAQTIEDCVSAHTCSPGRMRNLSKHLGILERQLGADRPIQTVELFELQVARKTVSPGYAHDVTKSWKWLFRRARQYKWIAEDPAADLANPREDVQEVTPFPWESVWAVSDEIHLNYEALPVFATGTGLRPEEYLATERRDIDLARRVVHVRRVWVDGQLIELGRGGRKTRLQRRDVPLRKVVIDALGRSAARVDTPLLFPGRRRNRHGGWHTDLDHFRHDVWKPALAAAGVTYQRPYDMRHTYATDAIATEIDLFTLSRRMGTSTKQIDATYGHLWDDAAERELERLDAFDARRAAGG